MGSFKSKAKAFFGTEGFMGTSMTALVIGVVIAFNAVIYALTSAFGLYLYVPDSFDMSISGNTDVLFESVKDKERIKVIFCREEAELEGGENDEVASFYYTAKQFRERYGDLVEIECVNLITKRNQKGELVKNMSDYQLKTADGELYPMQESTVVFVSEHSHKTIADISSTTFTYDTNSSSEGYGTPTSYNGEEVFASMMLWVMSKEHPKAYFTTFHGEVADVTLANMLSCAGYEIDTIDLREADMVPADAGMVIISNPVKDFERAVEGSGIYSEIEKLREYLNSGGRLYAAIDPYVEGLTNLEGLLSEYGITVSESEIEGKMIRDIVRDSENAVTADSFTLIAGLPETETGELIRERLERYGSSGVLIRECAALELSGGAEPLLVSSAASSTYAGGVETDSRGGYALAAMSVNENDNGTKSRVFVVPSIYLAASDMLTMVGYGNRNFIYSVFEQAYEIEDLPYGCKTTVFYTNGMLENFTMGNARFYTALILTVPVIIAIVGAVVVIKRKNR